MTFEVLLSCMNKTDDSIVNESNLNDIKTLIINQCGVDEYIQFDDNHRMINSSLIGLSKSRNIGINTSKADICLLADDDEIFIDGLEEIILSKYESINDADIIVFNISNYHKALGEEERRLKFIDTFRVSSVQISFKRNVIVKNEIRFDENMGAGSGNGTGEENKFLVDALNKGLKIYFCPIDIAELRESSSSTWFNGFDREFFYNKGMTTRYTYGLPFSVFYLTTYVPRKYKKYRGQISPVTALIYSLKGIFDNKLENLNQVNYLPKVSVIIPTYKRSEMLSRAIDSVLSQTYKNVEVVVVDDNNPDTDWRKNTADTMQKYVNDLRVKYVCHEKNMNGSVARNTGIKSATGEIVAFLDDDDWYLPTKIEKQVKYLLDNPKYRAVYCGWHRDGKTELPTAEGDLSYNLLSGDHIIYTNAIMMWKTDAIACGGWDETFKRHQEAAYLLRYFRAGGLIGTISEPLVEFDVEDRSNAASDSDVSEQQLTFYLDSYRDMIDRCECEEKGAKRDIISHRYRGALLRHIKYKNFKSAIKLYLRMIKKMPIKFNVDIAKYIINRIFG